MKKVVKDLMTPPWTENIKAKISYLVSPDIPPTPENVREFVDFIWETIGFSKQSDLDCIKKALLKFCLGIIERNPDENNIGKYLFSEPLKSLKELGPLMWGFIQGYLAGTEQIEDIRQELLTLEKRISALESRASKE